MKSILAIVSTLAVHVSALAATIEVKLPTASREGGYDGRLLVIFAAKSDSEPRFQVSDGLKGAQVFGIDVEGAAPGAVIRFGDAAAAKIAGYPLVRMSELPAGEYHVQALLHLYETFQRADGHVVKLPMDRGEGQQWSRAPGNPYSTPRAMSWSADASLAIDLDQVMPPITPPADTKYVKHIRIRSELLSKFWGRAMHLGAVVLLPHGFDEHPDARYPLLLNHGHFEATFDEFREAPPDPDLKPDYSERFRMHGYNRLQQELGHGLFRTWTASDFPRFLAVKVQHANPYYDDSYAVNSANVGPYGDAIMRELLPFVEKTFRGIGEGWARFTCGGSTGGWEALAAQVFYPDEFNGCFAACPDPIDFRAYCLVNLYEQVNAYYTSGDLGQKIEIPAARDHLNRVVNTMALSNRYELALGTRSRSGQQFDIWEAVYGPVGRDGYPARIFDKETGVIDKAVAEYWRQNFDLRAILERDWATLGPKLQGKIHIYCGTLDNYYLDSAVYLMEEFLEATKDPHYGGVVDYGLKAEHCWNGDHERPNAVSRLRYNVMYADRMLARIAATAPQGADTKSWRH
jgi:Putative esterase